MRIISPFPSGLTTILIKQGPVTTTVRNGQTFAKVPYEDPQALDILVGYVEVPFTELEAGVYQLKANSVSQDDGHGNTVVIVEKVEWYRNRHT